MMTTLTVRRGNGLSHFLTIDEKRFAVGRKRRSGQDVWRSNHRLL
jgi:hypothetical protein